MHPFVRASPRGQLHHTKRPPFFHPPSRHLRRFLRPWWVTYRLRIGATRAQTACSASSFKNIMSFYGDLYPTYRTITYPTIGQGKSSSNVPFGGDMLVSWRVIIIITSTNLFSMRQCWEWWVMEFAFHRPPPHENLICELLKKYTNMQSSDFFGCVSSGFLSYNLFGRFKLLGNESVYLGSYLDRWRDRTPIGFSQKKTLKSSPTSPEIQSL